MAKHTEGAHAAGGRTLRCIVVTPEATSLETTADFVALPLLDGEMGIAPAHSPMIGRLGFGEMRIVSGGQTRRFYVEGGFVQVADNVVSVLTNRATPAEKIAPEAAARQLEAARTQPATSEEALQLRERAEAQARAQLRIARRAGRGAAPVSAGHH